jgi:CheY-like chemotaxis protein
MAASGPVLVVDDDVDTRECVCAVLDMAGFEVRGVENGREALHELERGDRPCLILLDLQMPVMDGFEFRRIQARDPRWRDIPVVVFSGHYDVAESARRLAVPQHFQKPLDMDAIIAIAERHCAEAPALQ